VIDRSTNIRRALRQRQRGFIINPFRFGGGGGGGGDPNFANVSSLLHFDGTNGSTTFTDQKSISWTAVGDAQLATDVAKFGTAALKLDGTGDYAEASSPAGFDFGTGDFTIEGWVHPDSTSTNWLCSAIDAGAGGWALSGRHASFGNVLRFYSYVRAAGYNGSTVVTTGAWHHVAATRASGTLRVFLDGALEITLAGFTDNFPAPVRARIGSTPQTTSGQQISAACRIDDLRVTKGVARYTAAFTPPTEAFPDS